MSRKHGSERETNALPLQDEGFLMLDDLDHYLRRANEARTAAIVSRDPAARTSHAAMAREYEGRAGRIAFDTDATRPAAKGRS